MNKASITVVIPAYNEEATVTEVFTKVRRVLEAMTDDFEIILCDDASHDQTKGMIANAVATCPQAKAIYHPINQGIFKTFEELYGRAQKDLVILFPGDDQWDPSLLPQAMAAMEGHDVVIAARRMRQYTVFRKLNSWVFNTLVRVLYGINLHDIGTVKLFRRRLLQEISVSTRSAFTEAERLIKAHRAGYKINVIWVEHKARSKGKATGASWKNIARAFGDLIKFRFQRP